MKKDDILIKTENLNKKFGKRIAVKNLNLEIKRGQIFSLLGTNGAGKTTTIKMLSCLIPADSGSAIVAGLNTKINPLKIKAKIGVSPQETAIAQHLTSKENLLLMGGISGLSNRLSEERAVELMDLLEIEDRKEQSRKLSGGLKRRLSIAMALIHDPEILFLDEPTLGLDPHSRRSVWTYIEKLKGNKTILLTTHYLEEADALSDKIAIMDAGKILDRGSSKYLKNKVVKKNTLILEAEYWPIPLIQLLDTENLIVRKTEKALEISLEDSDIYAVMEKLKISGVELTSIQMKEPSLDDVFLQLTQKTIKNEIHPPGQ